MRALFLLSALLLLLPPARAEDGEKPVPETTPVTRKTDLLDAVPVEGKRGYVKSPHAPNAGLVDVRGFPAGTEIKCPYTGRIFILPPEAARATDVPDDTTVSHRIVGEGKLPTAKPVPDKPGFVFSPFADEVVYINVQGMPRGTKVKDPFSGKEFLVP